MKHMGKINAQNGFTLIELLIALTIFAVSMTAIIPLLVATMKGDRQTLFRVKAQSFATARLDELISRRTLQDCAGADYFCRSGYDTPGVDAPISCTDYINALTEQTSVDLAVILATTSVPITRTWTAAPMAGTNLCSLTSAISYTYQGEYKTFASASLRGR